VLCRFTAFVAVDDSGRHVSGTPHTIVQPVELPSGWSAGALGGPGPMMARRMTAMTAPSEAAAAPRFPEAAPPHPGLGPEVTVDPVPSTGPRVRLPGRHSGGGRFRPYDEPVVPDPIESRLDELLAAVEGLLASVDGWTAPAATGHLVAVDAHTLAGELRTLAGDLRTLAGDLRRQPGAEAEALALGLEGLATALDRGHWQVATAEVEGFKQLLKDRPIRQGWWR
jgi:Ca-activated chloride channel homolog